MKDFNQMWRAFYRHLTEQQAATLNRMASGTKDSFDLYKGAYQYGQALITKMDLIERDALFGTLEEHDDAA